MFPLLFKEINTCELGNLNVLFLQLSSKKLVNEAFLFAFSPPTAFRNDTDICSPSCHGSFILSHMIFQLEGNYR